MKNSVRLPVLIGCLAMPGLALVAVWLWSMRRARAQESNHSNHTEMRRELQGVAEEFKIITQKRGTEIATPIDLGCRKSAENSCNDLTNNAKQNRSLSTGQELDVSSISRVECPDSVSEMAVENGKRHELGDKSNKESSESSRNRHTNYKENSNEPTGGMNSNDSFANGSFQDSAKTSEQRGCTLSPKASGHNIDGSDNVEYSPVKDQTDASLNASGSQKGKNITRVDSKVSSSRSQSLDESSDVSSIDSKRESPLAQKTSSTPGSDCESSQPEHGEEITWELEFPQALCGRLIGKKGKNVQKISQITGTKIRLIPQKENSESSQRLVALTGSPKQLALALKALREKFPSVPFTRLNGNKPYVEGGLSSPTPNVACVVLPENELCQVFVTNIVDANHFYVQLYDHLIHTHLRQLDQQMYQFYGGLASTMMPQTINTGMFCAAVSPNGWWWRAQVVGLLMKPDEVEITWLDYGGRTTVPTTMLRQLR